MALKWMNDLYPIFFLLLLVHPGRESCGGIITSSADSCRRHQSMRLDVAPCEADRFTALSLGLPAKVATPMGKAFPSSA